MRKTEQRDRKESRALKGEEERRRLQFLADVTVARFENFSQLGIEDFQQILAWTLKSRWQKQDQLLREVAASYRSEK
jgi:hypothetical protein